MPGLEGSPASVAVALPPLPSTHLISFGNVIVIAAGFRSDALMAPCTAPSHVNIATPSDTCTVRRTAPEINPMGTDMDRLLFVSSDSTAFHFQYAIRERPCELHPLPASASSRRAGWYPLLYRRKLRTLRGWDR